MPDTDSNDLRAQLDAVQNDLLAVLRHHNNALGIRMCTHALIELTGSVCVAVSTIDPGSRNEIRSKLESLRLLIAPEDTRTH